MLPNLTARVIYNETLHGCCVLTIRLRFCHVFGGQSGQIHTLPCTGKGGNRAGNHKDSWVSCPGLAWPLQNQDSYKPDVPPG